MARARSDEPLKETGDKLESLIDRTDPEADERRESREDDDEEAFERDPDDEGPEDSDSDDE